VIQLQKEQLRHNRPGFVHISGALHCGAYTARTDYSRNGRIQTLVRRVLIVRGKPMSTTELRLAIYGRPTRLIKPRLGRSAFAVEVEPDAEWFITTS
jgi:hypothetical protein